MLFITEMFCSISVDVFLSYANVNLLNCYIFIHCVCLCLFQQVLELAFQSASVVLTCVAGRKNDWLML